MNGNLALDIAAFAAKAGARADEVVRGVVLELGRSVILMSPVGNPDLWKNPAPKGYVGGHFRGNWQFSIGEAPEGEIDRIDPSGAETITALTAAVSGFMAGQTGYIANNLPYANRLEYGWSTQAPAGMARITVARFQTIVDESVVVAEAAE